MASSARWPSILQSLELIGTVENVKKLNLESSKSVRDSIILMLQSANKRFLNVNADWVVERGLGAILSAIIAAVNAGDFELEILLRQFLKVTVFPPSLYRAYKDESKEDPSGGVPEEKEPEVKKSILTEELAVEKSEQEEPELKKMKLTEESASKKLDQEAPEPKEVKLSKEPEAKISKPVEEPVKAKLWSQADHYVHPSKALILCEGMAEAYGRRLMAYPFLKIMCTTGFDHKNIPNPGLMTNEHCRLIAFFAKFIDKERLHVKRNKQSHTGSFIKNSIHALLANTKIDVFELEDLINIVADLDPYLLQPLNTLLWKRWTSGELITVMIKLCAFYGRRQSSRSMFGLIFQSKFVLSPNLQEIFSEPFQQLTKAWLPSALLSDLNYLTGTVLNLMKDDRNINGPNESVYSVIDIFLIVIGFELDEINLEQLNYSEQDEKELLSNLDNIAKILEDYQTVSKYWLLLTSKFWRLEKQRRLFIDCCNSEFLNEKILLKMAGYTNLKTYGNSGINSHFELGLSRLEWSIYNETNIKTSAKNFCKTTLLLLEKDSKIDVSKTCQNMLRKILPVAFRAAPKAMTKVVSHLCKYGPGDFGTSLLEDDLELQSSVIELASDSIEYKSILESIPLSFIEPTDIEVLFPADEFKPSSSNVDMLYQVLSSPSNSAEFVKTLKIDNNFYESLAEILPEVNYPDAKELIRIVIKSLCKNRGKEKFTYLASSIKKSLDDDARLELCAHEWLMILLTDVNLKDARAIELGKEMSELILSKTESKFFGVQCDAVHLMLSCFLAEGTTVEVTDCQRANLKTFYDALLMKLAFSENESDENRALSGRTVSRVFTLLGDESRQMSLCLLKDENISDATVQSCYSSLGQLLPMRLATMPVHRYRIELISALDVIGSQYKEEPAAQKELVEKVFAVATKSGDFWLRYEISRKFLEMKNLKKKNLILRSILLFMIETPKTVTIDVLKAIYTNLNLMCINNSSKLILLVPAIVSILKHYLELTVLLSKEDKEISLSYYKRLTTYIRGNNVLKQKLGICLGFVFVDYAKLQIIYPDGGLMDDILFQHFYMMSKRQVLAFSAQLDESHKRIISQSYDAWEKVKGHDGKRYMTV